MADQSPRLTSLSPGAGCACKLPLAKLEALFASMGPVSPASGDLLIGAAEGDDAAVLRLDDERAHWSSPPTSSPRSSTTRRTGAGSPPRTRSPTCTRWAAGR